MARFKFHSSLEDILIADFECEDDKTIKAVANAADSGDFTLDRNDLDQVAEEIYSTQKYWE